MRGFGIVGVVVAVVSGCGPATSGPCVAEALTTAAVAGGKTLAPFSCWTADREINVSDGTLAIGEGVTITFAQNASLRVTGQGRLRAVGTAAAPIVLRGQDDRRGAWKGVGVSTDATDNRLEHVQLTGAGNAAWTGNNDSKAALFVDDVGGLALVSTRISKSAWYGVFTEGAASRIGPFTGVRFDDNERIARLHANTAGAFGGDTTFDGNSESVVRLGYGASDQVRAAATWRRLAVPWLVTARVLLYAAVTIEAGATFRFAQGAGFNMRNDAGNSGSLDATGTAAAPIVFTGEEELAGSWLGLAYETSSTSNKLAHASVRFAGRQGWDGNSFSKAAVYVDNNSSLALDTVTIGSSAGYGLHLVSATNSQASCTAVTFEASNASGPISIARMAAMACP
ncbi:MAG: hypothetical protein Q8S33_15520 [Myxococcales bacterium]|nr:hypothetical protein [Myxococcales bacterium]